MNDEALYSKSAIAEELAHRDIEIERLLNIAQQAHDRLLRGDSDKNLLLILESSWKDRPNAKLTGAPTMTERHDNYKCAPVERTVIRELTPSGWSDSDWLAKSRLNNKY